MTPRSAELPTLERTTVTTLDVTPTPVAMVWQGRGRPFEAIAVPMVSLAESDVLVEVEFATICGSDLHTILGHRPAALPLMLGHEQVGRITATGGSAFAVDGTPLEEGMRVVWSVAVSCGTCDRCERGLTQKCRHLLKYGHDRPQRGWELNGGFGSHVVVLGGTPVVVVDERTPAEVLAPASCSTATVAAALDAASVVGDLAGVTVAITGAGMLGLTACAWAADRGAHVIVADPAQSRRERALRFGARRVCARLTADEIASLAPSGDSESEDAECLVVLEMSGHPSAVASAFDVVGTGGVVVLAGSAAPVGNVPIDPESLVRRCLTVRGVHNYTARHLVDAANYLTHAWRRRPFAQLVGRSYPLAQIDEAVAVAAEGADVRVGLHQVTAEQPSHRGAFAVL